MLFFLSILVLRAIARRAHIRTPLGFCRCFRGEIRFQFPHWNHRLRLVRHQSANMIFKINRSCFVHLSNSAVPGIIFRQPWPTCGTVHRVLVYCTRYSLFRLRETIPKYPYNSPPGFNNPLSSARRLTWLIPRGTSLPLKQQQRSLPQVSHVSQASPQKAGFSHPYHTLALYDGASLGDTGL